MHILIIGARGVGKSTLIRRVLQEIDAPATGYTTVKEDALADAENGSPIYIYPYGEAHIRTDENLVGYCKQQHPKTYVEAFDRFAKRLEATDGRGVVVLDELGFMESKATEFKRAVLGLLDGSATVIAAVKDSSTEFLDAVKAHPNCKRFYIDRDNRDDLFPEVLAFLKAQLEQA